MVLTCSPNEDLNQPTLPRILISLRRPHEGTLGPWLSKMHPVKILFKLCEWWVHMSEGTFSDVDAHIYILWENSAEHKLLKISLCFPDSKI